MKKVVVKIGSSVIAPGGKIDAALIKRLIKDILAVERKGYRVIMVSSGAIACGLNALGYKKRPSQIHTLMALSSFGQIILMDVFNATFKKHKRRCAQMLLTWDDFDNRKRFMNIRRTIEMLLSINIIPVINENDVVSFEEIRFGDNDRLSALVADLTGADMLIMLSDVAGLLKDGTLVKEVTKIDATIRALAKKEDKTHTSGGMATKLDAANIAVASGINAVIASGKEKQVVSRIIRGEQVGTHFLASDFRTTARKRWIAFSKKTKGTIIIDQGAKEAIVFKGRSLLGVGIIKSEGEFKKGDSVCVVDEQGNIIGCGVVNYPNDALKNPKEKRFQKEVIHRDNFVQLD